jgi:hypothetical protein
LTTRAALRRYAPSARTSKHAAFSRLHRISVNNSGLSMLSNCSI